MGKSERVREVLTGPLTAGELDRRAAEGWHPVAVEWERLVDSAEDWRPPVQEVPYGLRVAADNKHLEEHPEEV
jgi:hypothetical protein